MDGLSELLPYLTFIGGIALLIWILMRRGTQRQARSRKQEGKSDGHLVRTPRPTEKPWTMSDGPADLQRWQVEMLETTRQLQGEINTKLRLLVRWQELARQEADRLAELLDRAEAQAVPTGEAAYDYLQQLLAEIGDTASVDPPPFTQVSEILCNEEKRLRIYELADQQTTVPDIARKTETDATAVEMILKLRTRP